MCSSMEPRNCFGRKAVCCRNKHVPELLNWVEIWRLSRLEHKHSANSSEGCTKCCFLLTVAGHIVHHHHRSRPRKWHQKRGKCDSDEANDVALFEFGLSRTKRDQANVASSTSPKQRPRWNDTERSDDLTTRNLGADWRVPETGHSFELGMESMRMREQQQNCGARRVPGGAQPVSWKRCANSPSLIFFSSIQTTCIQSTSLVFMSVRQCTRDHASEKPGVGDTVLLTTPRLRRACETSWRVTRKPSACEAKTAMSNGVPRYCAIHARTYPSMAPARDPTRWTTGIQRGE